MQRPVRALLTVSGRAAPAGGDGDRPRPDYHVLAAATNGHLVDFQAAGTDGVLGRVTARLLGDDAALAVACFRRRLDYDVVFTDSERVGMLFAVLCSTVRRRPRHVMVGHRLSAPSKLRLHRALRLGRRIDHVIVYCSAQRSVATEQLAYPPHRVTLSSFMVDTRFWTREPPTVAPSARPMICAVGQELRDYPTLVVAVDGLDVDVVIAAASPWSKRADSSDGLAVPANVSVERLGPAELRRLYARADLVVVPIVETDFQAGITTILEAMAMGLAVVCTRTRGQTDTIVDGETGCYVPPADPAALGATLARLLSDTAEAERLGRAGRRWVLENADIEVYAARLAAVITPESTA